MTRLTIICISFIIVSLMFAGQSSAEIDPETVLGIWLLDEGSGDTTEDASGNGNDGTLGGGPTWIDGVYGKALDFTGSNSYVDCGNAEALNVDVFSVSFWCYIPSTQGWNHIISRGNHDGVSVNWGVMMYDGQETILYETFNDTTWSGITASTTTGEWHHIVATYDGDMRQLYHDGVLASTGSDGMLLDESRAFVIGAKSNVGSNSDFFSGSIDEVGYFNTVLAPEDIEEIMNNGLATIIRGQPLATAPDPEDGAVLTEFMSGMLGYSLMWKPGDFADSHDVYFGENFDDVNDGTGDTFRGNQSFVFFLAGYGYTPNDPVPTGFVPGTTYYWRIDEVNDANDESPWKGKVWSFSLPATKAYSESPGDGTKFIDPNADLSWEPGFGAIAQTVYFGDDYDTISTATSDGTAVGGAATYDPGPLEPEKTYYWRVDVIGAFGPATGDVWSFTTARLGGGLKGDFYHWSGNFPPSQPFQIFVLSRIDPQINFSWGTGSPDPSVNIDNFACRWVGEVEAAFTETYTFETRTDDGARLWVNGQQLVDQWVEQGATPARGTIDLVAGQRYPIVMEHYENGGDAVAELRWSSPSTPKDFIPQAAFSPPVNASGPNPPNGATGVKMTPTLTWSAGDSAVSHQVYFGTDADAVRDATTASPEYIGTRALGSESYNPGKLAWDSTYYWRIDEVNNLNPDSPWIGNLWSFTTGDFLVVDNFEDYDVVNQIWYNWVDGLGYVKPDNTSHPGNGSGGEVGDPDTASFTEETIVHSGSQSMPFNYNNNDPFKLKYSEVTLTLSNTRDWTEEGVKALSLWFQGRPASVGSFTDNFDGTYTMTGSGLDIWDITGIGTGFHDEFHFAYKTLTGAGTIIARVDSVGNTNDWAKAGVMIRETLDANSPHAFACVTPANGVASQGRLSIGAASFNTAQGAGEIAAPHWVRLERSMSGDFTVTHSTNGSTWEPVEGAIMQNIPMNSNVYVGLAVTAHNDGNPVPLTCEAAFSSVTFTGNVTGQWASQDIGIMSNDAEPLYVAIANNTGPPAVVVHDDPNAAQIDEWTEWNIDLRDFTGINLADVNSIAVGVGNRNNPQAGGKGKMYFDDFALYRPRCVPEEVTLSEADLNSDCVVDFKDLEIMTGDWLAVEPDPDVVLEADLNSDGTVDFKDYAVLADDWLDEQIWPDL